MKEIIYLDQEIQTSELEHISFLSESYKVTPYQRFDLAKKDLLERKVDMVIMDIILPFKGFTAEETDNGYKTGLKVLEVLRSEGSANRETPVVIQTLYPKSEMEKECTKRGATLYLTKPTFPD